MIDWSRETLCMKQSSSDQINADYELTMQHDDMSPIGHLAPSRWGDQNSTTHKTARLLFAVSYTGT